MRAGAGALLALAAAAPAHAQLSACYDATWLGFPVAEAVYEEAADGSVVRTRFTMESVGLVELFGPFRYEVTAETAAVEEGFRPRAYTVLDGPEDGERYRIDLAFDAATGAVDQTDTPAGERTVLEPEVRAGTIDPITAFIAVRGAIRAGEARGLERMHLPVYDGSLRYDAEVVLAGRERVRGMGEAVKALVTVEPIAGFDDPDKAEALPALVWFGPDRDFMPIKVDTGGGGQGWLADYREDGACRF